MVPCRLRGVNQDGCAQHCHPQVDEEVHDGLFAVLLDPEPDLLEGVFHVRLLWRWVAGLRVDAIMG